MIQKTLFVCAAMLMATGAAKADLDGWLADQETNSSVFDVWSPGGHAWSVLHQPEYSSHILLANGDRHRVLNEQAQMEVDIVSSPLNPHMLGFAFYTGYGHLEDGHATFTITPSAVSPSTSLILMGIVYTGRVSPNPVLNYGSKSIEGTDVSQTVNLGESIVVDDPEAPVSETQFRVFTWDVSDMSGDFTITFTFPKHVAFSHIVISQVPEPATAALLVGALAAGAVWFARRRRSRV